MKYFITLFLLLFALPSLGRDSVNLTDRKMKAERSKTYVPQAYYEEGTLSLCSICTLYDVQITIINTKTCECVYQGSVTITNGTLINIPLNLPLGNYQLNLDFGNHSYYGYFDIDDSTIL